jgi:hypothetical protein
MGVTDATEAASLFAATCAGVDYPLVPPPRRRAIFSLGLEFMTVFHALFVTGVHSCFAAACLAQ